MKLPLLAAMISLSFAGSLAADELASGAAKGTFSSNGEPAVALTNAAAFVDVKDDDKPVIVLISDKKLPTEKWTSEFDLMREHPNFSGVIFWINKDGEIYRRDAYWKGKQSSVSGYFDIKLDSKPGDKEIKGSAHPSESLKANEPKLEVVFHATLK